MHKSKSASVVATTPSISARGDTASKPIAIKPAFASNRRFPMRKTSQHASAKHTGEKNRAAHAVAPNILIAPAMSQ